MKHTVKMLKACVGLMLITGIPATAQDYDISEVEAAVPSKDEIIQALTPRPPLVTRSVDGGPPPPIKPRAIPLRIEFKFDSYELSDAARELLNNLGAALVSADLSTYRFRVEGHTDATGSDAYNRTLSRRRADGVCNYLISIFEMEPGRLESVGRGESALLNPDDPDSAENRAVLIVNLGPAGS